MRINIATVSFVLKTTEPLMRQCLAVLLVCLTTTAVELRAQPKTIPARIEAFGRPGPLVMERIEESVVPPDTFESAARKADVILEGSLTKLTSYLSKDQEDVYTDYEVTPLNVISSGVALQSLKPGPQARIVIRIWGGETTINGVEVKMFNSSLRPLPIGRPLLLLLIFNKEIGKYEIYWGGAFAFEIDERRRLKSRLPPGMMEPKFRSDAVDDAIRLIHQWRR